MTDDASDRLQAALPQETAARVQSLRLAEGRVTIVLDASGLDARARAGLESSVREALESVPDIAEVRVALMADKGAGQAGQTKPVQKIVAVGSGK
ncbi:MAG: chromosome partitioning protein ParA, partial [Novosphingobium sp.]